MIDVKKLITGFLVLAVASTAAAFLIGNTQTYSAASQTADIGGAASPSSATGNAFAANPTQIDDAVQVILDDSSTTDAIANDPNNLTNILANTYTANLALTNPSGFTTDADGNPTLTPPDATSVIEQFMSSSTSANVQIPDWDTEADQIPIHTVPSSAKAAASYGNAISGIIDTNMSQDNLQSMLSGNDDPSFEPYVENKVQTALQDIAGLETPVSAVPLQKSLIKTLVYAKDEILLAENASADPVKTELILGGESPQYDAALADLQTQIQKAQASGLFSLVTAPASAPKENKTLASLQSIFGIPVANAQIAVYDPVNHVILWAQLGKLIENELKDVALQITKNTIVFLMQRVIFAKIQGSGAPAFIQQWGTTLANAFQTSALNALNNQMQCVGAAPFAPQLRLRLNAIYQPTGKTACAVQFNSQLGNNLKNFYNNFSNGGWVSYGQTLTPNYDYFGYSYFTDQSISLAAQNAQNSVQTKAVANQGFSGSAVCADGSNPNGNVLQCQDPTGLITTTQNPTCPAGTVAIQVIPLNGTCENGKEPLVQTPGTIFNSMVNSAVDGNFKLVTSATSWEGLASGLFVSILQQTLNSLAQTAITSVNGLLQQAANGGGANSVSSNGLNVTSSGSSQQPITCTVSPDPAGNPLAAYINVSGGQIIDTNGGISTPFYMWASFAPSSTVATSTPNGDTVTATFNASGTYWLSVDDTTDSTSTTCGVTIPVASQ